MSMTMEEARKVRELARKRQMAEFMWAGFYRCPTTGRILEQLPGDDKVLCGCGKSNPRVPAECTERTHTHLVRFLQAATVDEYVAQEDARREQARRA